MLRTFRRGRGDMIHVESCVAGQAEQTDSEDEVALSALVQGLGEKFEEPVKTPLKRSVRFLR